MKTYLRNLVPANRIFALMLVFSLSMSSFLFWSVESHAEDEIPEYSGEATTVVNKNVPEFMDEEITTSSFESYGKLDKLGRVTTAYACIGRDLMPNKERGSIGGIRPTGWKQKKYPGIVDSDPPYLYNRCHMIGYQLTGENDNKKNLITGTRYMNVEGMLPYENQVADYIESSGNHVMYRVTPVFEGKNLLCNGVQIEAYSVEDKGKGISFNIFCYNVQPGIEINYANGSNKLAPDAEIVNDSNSFMITGGDSGNGLVRSSAGSEVSGIPAGTTYVVNKNTGKFHYPGCSSVNDMKEKNKVYSTKTREELINEGRSPCKRCNP